MNKSKFIDKLIEFYRLSIYDYKDKTYRIFNILSLILSFIAVISIIYFHGFPKTEIMWTYYKLIITVSFIFYIIKYIINGLLENNFFNYIKKNWFESIIMFFILFDGAGLYMFEFKLISFVFKNAGIHNIESFSNIFIQLYFLVIVAIEVGKASQKFLNSNMSPYTLLNLSFIFIISIGTLLLLMPEMTYSKDISFIDSLFTSTSACCVTGLITLDTATFFTYKGQFVIMMLIKLGGLNILSFAAFFASFYKESSGLKYQTLIKDLFNSDYLSDSKVILRKVLLFSFIIEFIGFIFIFLGWNENVHFIDLKEKVFYSIFHSISAFNNAGFSLYTNNLFESYVRNSYIVHVTIAMLIIFGGLGFYSINDIFNIKKLKNNRTKMWNKLEVNTKIVLSVSFFLIIIGAIIIFVLEYNNTLNTDTLIVKISNSIFQSISARTAGFNTIDISLFLQPTLLIIIILMFIGASPGSTGGGIKTTTFYLILKAVSSTVTGKKHIETYHRNISFSNVDKAFTIIIFSLSIIFLSSIALSITEPNINYINLLFEEVSAYGTVGLSTGITSSLSSFGKIIIIISMFIGRVGPLSIAFSISKKVKTSNYKYADVNVMIG